MKNCESGCGGIVKVSGCKWCPDCYPNFSRGQTLNEQAFYVVAGKYDFNEENIKFSSDVMTLPEAEALLKKVSGYPFSRIEYFDQELINQTIQRIDELFGTDPCNIHTSDSESESESESESTKKDELCELCNSKTSFLIMKPAEDLIDAEGSILKKGIQMECCEYCAVELIKMHKPLKN